ncbi:hypothetical protein AKJ49_00165 [candidate division MSBL1 archaeon SCGC-AAA382A03]|uniref:Peptidase M24 domain-containing protein n=1 Tax=candidate division MSBL1 archaeon SCGC-AAA382A03 TaxID=1698278 RepID=A0A133VH75_9EURY|nr:hypothetical protein AKJ49_00165 [candidate division MSBL1 archaeon SCGC-AAA382A03]
MGVAISKDSENFIFFETEEEELLAHYTTVAPDMRVLYKESNLTEIEFVIENLKKEEWLDSTVGLELRNYRPNPYHARKLQEAFEKEGCEIVDGTDIVRDLRSEKSPLELAYIRKAGKIADIGMKAAIDFIEPGVTELEIKGEMEKAMSEVGGECTGIPNHVATGSRIASLHSLAGRNEVMPGDLVCIDMCGVFNRYHANISRMISVGAPDPKVAEQIELAAGAMSELEKIIEPNVKIEKINKKMKDYYENTGIWEDRWYVGGYELGIAFPPDWVGEFIYGPEEKTDEGVLTPGTVVNYESDFYLPRGAGMCGIIDSIIIEEDGAEILSDITPNLTIV